MPKYSQWSSPDKAPPTEASRRALEDSAVCFRRDQSTPELHSNYNHVFRPPSSPLRQGCSCSSHLCRDRRVRFSPWFFFFSHPNFAIPQNGSIENFLLDTHVSQKRESRSDSFRSCRFHYEKHHRGYVVKLNELANGTDLAKKSLEDVVKTEKGKPFNLGAQVRGQIHPKTDFFLGRRSAKFSPSLRARKIHDLIHQFVVISDLESHLLLERHEGQRWRCSCW
jgi:hypothetical protein